MYIALQISKKMIAVKENIAKMNMNVATFNGLELEWKEHVRLVSKKDSEATVETISAETQLTNFTSYYSSE